MLATTENLPKDDMTISREVIENLIARIDKLDANYRRVVEHLKGLRKNKLVNRVLRLRVGDEDLGLTVDQFIQAWMRRAIFPPLKSQPIRKVI